MTCPSRVGDRSRRHPSPIASRASAVACGISRVARERGGRTGSDGVGRGRTESEGVRVGPPGSRHPGAPGGRRGWSGIPGGSRGYPGVPRGTRAYPGVPGCPRVRRARPRVFLVCAHHAVGFSEGRSICHAQISRVFPRKSVHTGKLHGDRRGDKIHTCESTCVSTRFLCVSTWPLVFQRVGPFATHRFLVYFLVNPSIRESCTAIAAVTKFIRASPRVFLLDFCA